MPITDCWSGSCCLCGHLRYRLQVPEGVSDEQCILLGDILSTAFFCADQGGIGSGVDTQAAASTTVLPCVQHPSANTYEHAYAHTHTHTHAHTHTRTHTHTDYNYWSPGT
jgi:hypothetical protein